MDINIVIIILLRKSQCLAVYLSRALREFKTKYSSLENIRAAPRSIENLGEVILNLLGQKALPITSRPAIICICIHIIITGLFRVLGYLCGIFWVLL